MRSETQTGNQKPTVNPVPIKESKSSMHYGNSFDSAPDESELHKIIETRAYLLAEENGFNGSSVDFWLAAEQEVR